MTNFTIDGLKIDAQDLSQATPGFEDHKCIFNHDGTAAISLADGGAFGAGLDAHTGDVIDMDENNVVEPLRVKTKAVESATEAAIMLLRIDDVIAAGDLAGGQSDDDDGEELPDGPGGGMGGMM